MKKTLVAVGLALAFLGATNSMLAAEKEKAPADKPSTPKAAAPTEKAKKANHIPFRGPVVAVDKVAKTFTLGKEKIRTFHVTANTKIMKNGVPGVFADLAPEVPIRGSYHETEDGKLEVKSVYIDTNPPKPGEKAEKAADKAKEEKKPAAK